MGVILKNPLIIYHLPFFEPWEVKYQYMNSKTKALVLLSVIAVALVAVSFIFVLQSVKADTTTPVATASDVTPTAINATDNGLYGFGGFGNGPMMMGMAPRFGAGQRMERGLGGFGASAIQVSSDFTTNVTNVANNDSDVQNLLSQGYNITSIHPVISTTIDGNGNIVTKASTADVLMVGNNCSRAYLVVDLGQDKVTKIVTVAVTEIDK